MEKEIDMHKPTLISPDGSKRTVEPRNGLDFTLGELQKLVDGYIEVVRTSEDNILVVNEEGLLRDLKLNMVASALAGKYIVGPAVYMPSDMLK